MTTFEEKAHWAAEYLREALKIMLEMPKEFRDKTVEDNIRRAKNRILVRKYCMLDDETRKTIWSLTGKKDWQQVVLE